MFSATTTQNRPPTLANIVREETNDGRLIIRFLVNAMQGRLQNARPSHQLDAARQLIRIGFKDAQSFIDSFQSPSGRPAAKSAAARSTRATGPAANALLQQLAEIVRQETDNGRTAIRFLVNVMQGELKGFKPSHRLAAAKELLNRGFDDEITPRAPTRQRATPTRQRPQRPAPVSPPRKPTPDEQAFTIIAREYSTYTARVAIEMVRRYRLAEEATETTGRPNPLEIPEQFKGMHSETYKRLIQKPYWNENAAARVATVAAYEFHHYTPHLYCDYKFGQPGCPHDTKKAFDPLQTPPPKPAKTQTKPPPPSKPAEANNDSPPTNPAQEQNPAPNDEPPDNDHPEEPPPDDNPSEEYPPDDPPEPEQPKSEPRRAPLRNFTVERYPIGAIVHSPDHHDPWPDTTEHDQEPIGSGIDDVPPRVPNALDHHDQGSVDSDLPNTTEYNPGDHDDVITRVTGPPAPSAEPEPFKPYEILPGIRVTSPPVPIEYDDLDDPIPKPPR